MPYVERLLPNLLDDCRMARNKGSAGDFKRAVETLQIFLPMKKPKAIKPNVQSFKEGKWNGKGYFSKSWDTLKDELEAQFKEGSIQISEKDRRLYDYLLEFIVWQLEDAGLLVKVIGDAYDAAKY